MASKRTPFLLHVWMLGTWLLAYPIALIWRLVHRRMAADPARFSERLGYGPPQNAGSVVWFHAASLGEVMQIAPLAEHLTQTETSKILVTTTTASGADWVAREMPDVIHRFVPIDTPGAVHRFLDSWSITAAVFIEGDLWPRLLGELHKREIPHALVNARHSRTRARFPAVFSVLLASFAFVTCRSEKIGQDMRALGVPDDRVHVLPDLRRAVPKLAVPQDEMAALSTALGSRPVWLAASTHPADEQAVLDAHQEMLRVTPDAILILAPRHPERGQPLQTLAQSKGLSTSRRSLGEDLSDETQIYIADTLGELGLFFSLAPIVFLGGSFGTEGGHNPYEPARFATALLHGPNVRNFVDAYAAMDAAGASMGVSDPKQLGQALLKLMQDNSAQAMAQAGTAFMHTVQKNVSGHADLIAGLKR